MQYITITIEANKMVQHDLKQERRALFQERLAEDMDRVTKELLDAAERLSWTDGMNISIIDRWVETTTAALSKVKAARSMKHKLASG